MAKVFGEIECLERLISFQREVGVIHLKSLQDVLDYKKECEQKIELAQKVASLENVADITNIKQSLSSLDFDYLKIKDSGFILIRIFKYLSYKIKRRRLDKSLLIKQRHSENIIIEKVMKSSGVSYISKNFFDSNYNLIQGALGELQALEELKKLPDSFYVLNNITLKFRKPLYSVKNGQRIYSAQVDHVVVSPAGVFLIETKNWSKSTVNIESEYTVFDQIKRANFAFYCFLNPRASSFSSFFKNSKKVRVRNILLMTNQMTTQKENFIKVVNLLHVRQYITSFNDELSELQVQNIVSKLLGK
ncbi:hypothetical protein M899_1036 [Bacteriovorax sp. BSW11_IV]|uniref:nuclease-related domain-containing protein n=1 Tax=Bacteriovorax sp. BSW11_IV TaxID=1353529 RepID=UPI00038A4AC5|nr:nuclease-related domain-containing protein [Bacteriovorax sp. BSW11_IV]EQC48647.1 hypothetical protein M899_1036 [Bacteriovorax sp. BSW11_IV]